MLAHAVVLLRVPHSLRQSVDEQAQQLHKLRAQIAQEGRMAASEQQELRRCLRDVEQQLEGSRAQTSAQQRETAQLQCTLQQANADVQAAQVGFLAGWHALWGDMVKPAT